MDFSIQKELRKQLSFLTFGTLEITPEEEFVNMLTNSLETGIPLRVKCGIDPTSSDVHLGHSIPYRKMRQFQDFGHTGIVIIGDYTASIGDPTGKDQSRPPLDRKTIDDNAKRYIDQLYNIILPEKTEVHYQSEWFGRTSLREAISWMSQTTVSKLLGHETFRKRLDDRASLSLHELFYPVLQGIDSIHVKADVELGGSDQRFNVLMARDYQRYREMRPQTAMLLPILTGTCGVHKMSKSLGNAIGILDEPLDKFGKVMSIPDSVMTEYYKYLVEMTPEQFQQLEEDLILGKCHPNEMKKELASKIVSFYHGEEISYKMREQFENIFKRKQLPESIQEFNYTGKISAVDLLVNAKLVSSKKEAKRLISQGALSVVGGEKINDENFIFPESFKGSVIKLGKRKFLKLLNIKEHVFHLYSDGACRGNPGRGGWGILAEDSQGTVLFEDMGVDNRTTNNRMELQGAIEVLKQLQKYLKQTSVGEGFVVRLFSDSKYVVDGISKWVLGWKKKGWKKADKKVPDNLDLWKELDRLKGMFVNLQFIWVKGHNDHPQNERCDYLANKALDEYS